MGLALYDTQAREKRAFEPVDPGNVRMYVCGPTVYDRPHIGNARPIVVFDVLYRLLRHHYGEECVTYVRNITDVDDKINAAAKENGEPIEALTARTTRMFHDDIAALGALPPDAEPRATRFIGQMIAMAEALIAGGHAYEAEGHVLFDVPGMERYGELSHRDLDDMIAGARVEVAPYKKHPADFVVWKPSDSDVPGWDSPWGRGRPGWHLECSVMSAHYLGETFDIHGGGQDLIFPHHENERAQSLCAHPESEFARYWVHNGFVVVDREKMSKSLGNILTVRELLERGHRGETIRFSLLSIHYRKELNWTETGIRESKSDLDYMYKALWMSQEAGVRLQREKGLPIKIIRALDDDLNTPIAISQLHELAKKLHDANDRDERQKQARQSSRLLAAGDLLGILREDPVDWFQWAPSRKSGLSDAEIEALKERRIAARESRDFAEADKIRAVLAADGVILEDRPDGTTRWRRAG